MFAHTSHSLSPESSNTHPLYARIHVSQCYDLLLWAIIGCLYSWSESCDSLIDGLGDQTGWFFVTQPPVPSVSGVSSCSANTPTKIHMEFLSLSWRDQPHSCLFNTSPADKQEGNFIAEFKPVPFFLHGSSCFAQVGSFFLYTGPW